MTTKAEGKTFMFTGRISVTRKTAQEAVVRAGGIPGSSVCSTTDYLVVGEKPGSKLEKAEYWDVPTISEDEFWDMLEEYEEELPIEEWEENGIIVLDEKAFILMLDLLEWKQAVCKKERLEKEDRDSIEMWEPKSWEDMRVLNELLDEYNDVIDRINLVPQICPHCGFIIPYTIHNGYYYCFNCNCYTGSPLGGMIWKRHPEMPIYAHGEWQKCILTGKVRFVEKDELSKIDEGLRIAKLNHSAESALPVCRECRLLRQNRQQSRRSGQQILSSKTAEEIDQLYQDWLNDTAKREQKRLRKMQERQAKRARIHMPNNALIEADTPGA